jgi:enterochelin esterase family protein
MNTPSKLLCGFAALGLQAQVAFINAVPTPPPRVNPDLSVTFFMNAPDAKEVRFADSYHWPGPPGAAMTKGADGVWSLTTPPYEPGTHSYAFAIDGVLTGNIFSTETGDRLPRSNVVFEMIEVRGDEPLFTDMRAVPHGTMHIETFTSTRLRREARVFVYTPPGFISGERLPVLYLLHGNQGTEYMWSHFGYVERIADNLIADGKARRIVIAMPDTSGPNRGPLPQDLVEAYFISEIFPFVENKYLGAAATERYLAGLSAGANHTRFTGFRNPSLFAGLGMFSGGGLAMGVNLEEIHPALRDAANFGHMHLIYFAIGNEDTALGNVSRMSQSLRQIGIRHHLNISSSGHTFFNWRRYLAEFLKGL